MVTQIIRRTLVSTAQFHTLLLIHPRPVPSQTQEAGDVGEVQEMVVVVGMFTLSTDITFVSCDSIVTSVQSSRIGRVLIHRRITNVYNLRGHARGMGTGQALPSTIITLLFRDWLFELQVRSFNFSVDFWDFAYCSISLKDTPVVPRITPHLRNSFRFPLAPSIGPPTFRQKDCRPRSPGFVLALLQHFSHPFVNF
jgi:hypothetical protein